MAAEPPWLARIGLLLLLLSSPGCAAPRPAPVSSTAIASAPACVGALVPPRLTGVEPRQAAAGTQITVRGTGGFVEDGCGGYNESARTFPLFLDGQPIGDLGCYVNYCESEFSLPALAARGPHCLSLEPDACSLVIQILGD